MKFFGGLSTDEIAHSLRPTGADEIPASTGAILALFQMSSPHDDVTQLLRRWARGDRGALDKLMPLIYRELHNLAKRQMTQEEPGHTLQTTAVIHEAYLRLGGGSDKDWENRAHFFGVAAKAMRHVLVDHARTRRAAKRGGDARIEQLDDGADVGEARSAEMIALDDALTSLAGQIPASGRSDRTSLLRGTERGRDGTDAQAIARDRSSRLAICQSLSA